MSVAGSRVWPNSESRSGRSLGPSRSRFSVLACRTCGGSASMRSTSARHRCGCQRRSSSRSPGCPVEPVDQQLRSLTGVGREQPRQPPRHRVPAATPQLGFVGIDGVVAQMCCERATPVFAEAGVDRLEQRPRHGIRRPGVVVDGAGDLGDQRGGGAEHHPCAHPIGAVAAAEHMGEPLAQPPLHAARRHQHQFLGERVGQRIGQQLRRGRRRAGRCGQHGGGEASSTVRLRRSCCRP